MQKGLKSSGKEVLLITNYNTDGLVNCLLQPGQFRPNKRDIWPDSVTYFNCGAVGIQAQQWEHGDERYPSVTVL
jgi:hypothetical protein